MLNDQQLKSAMDYNARQAGRNWQDGDLPAALQQSLTTGWKEFSLATYAYQIGNGLGADGKLGPLTLAAIKATTAKPPACGGVILKQIGPVVFRTARIPISEPSTKIGGAGTIASLWNNYGGEIARQAALYVIPTEVALAIFSIEAGSRAYNPVTGLIMIRFEDHVFSDRSGQTCYAERGGQAAEWRNLERCAALDQYSAFASTSWGLPQLMGFNRDVTPYPTPMAMAEAFQASVIEQIRGFFQYVNNRGLKKYIYTEDWRGFTRLYNGVGNVDEYSTKLIKALAQIQALKKHGAVFGA